MMCENESFKGSKKERLYEDLFQSLDRLGRDAAEEQVLSMLNAGLAARLRAKARTGKDWDEDDLRAIFADLPPDFAAAIRAEVLRLIAERDLAKPNDGPDVVALKKATGKQLLDDADGATRGLPNRHGKQSYNW